jgi:pimeloyl-ACP methyl ester carboxylesterase
MLVGVALLALSFLAVNCSLNPDSPDREAGVGLPKLGTEYEETVSTPAPATIGSAAAESKYDDMDNWGVFNNAKGDKDVDMFLVYPTAIQSSDPEDYPYARITNSGMRSSAKQWYNGMVSICTTYTNAYMPYYRQANVFASKPDGYKGSGPDMKGGTGVDDVFEAFQWYLDNINRGQRPFIILGFSQGAAVVTEIASRFLRDHPEHNDRHIVSYAAGMGTQASEVKRNPQLKFSQSYNDLGVITSWNAVSQKCVDDNISWLRSVGAPGGPVTNPITWTTNETAVPASQNKRSLVNGRLQANYVGAQVNNAKGVLIVKGETLKDPTGSMSYHGQDIPFFYESVLDNIRDRIAAYKALNSATGVLATGTRPD